MLGGSWTLEDADLNWIPVSVVIQFVHRVGGDADDLDVCDHSSKLDVCLSWVGIKY